MLPACPHCDAQEIVIMKTQVMGWAEAMYDAHGLHIETSFDGLTSGRTGLIRCGNCREVRKDLQLNERRIVPKE